MDRPAPLPTLSDLARCPRGQSRARPLHHVASCSRRLCPPYGPRARAIISHTFGGASGSSRGPPPRGRSAAPSAFTIHPPPRETPPPPPPLPPHLLSAPSSTS